MTTKTEDRKQNFTVQFHCFHLHYLIKNLG